jgi:hypothetical protein
VALAPLALVLSLAVQAPSFAPSPSGGEDRLEYLYELTTTTSKVTLAWPRLTWDTEGRELLMSSNRGVQIFNQAGVEVYRFRETAGLGQITNAIPAQDGEVLLATVQDGKRVLVRCDFRGQPVEPVALKGFPPELADFTYGDVRRAGDRLYLFDDKRFRIVATTLDATFLSVVDFRRAMEADDSPPSDLEPRGFWVDAKGTAYVGFPFLFHVAVIGADGTVRGFGQKGSVAGKFNVIAAVAADDDGYVYVADILKSAVEVFDPQFHFVGQTSGLILPAGLAYGDGRLYVTQGGTAGVAVFKIRRK